MSTPPRHRFTAPSRRVRRRAFAGAALAALAITLGSAGYAEARGAPHWLSRLFRAVAGHVEVAAVDMAPNDTVVLFGPKTLALGSATSATFVERFTVSGLATNTTTPASSGYLLRTTNGPNGLGAITGGNITLNGAVVVSASQLAALSAGASLDVPVQVTPTDTIVAALTGPGGAGVSVSVLAAPDPTFLVFGAKQYERVNGAPVLITERFTVPAGGVAPSWLCVRNGELDGTRRSSSATVRLNGVDVVTQSELNQQVAGFKKRVTFLPAGQENVLEVQLQGTPGSRLTLCASATDAAPPVIAVTAPAKGLITNKPDVDAVGVVTDQTAVNITVNGVAATVAAGTAGKTSFTAKTPLASEGSNTITIHAVDAAGNATDSVRTVIRDTQAPVVTLDALPDSVLYRKDSVLTITGTITDRTAITANVNGVTLVVDTATHAFSQQVTLAQGTNFISITATDAAGNATSVVRQVTLDNVPPTLTLTAPAQGLVTKTATATVVGSAVGQSTVTVTVNGVNAAVGANGAFTSNVALTEGSNTITVVASNAAGVTATATRTVVLDTQAPVIAWSAPLDASFTKQAIVDVSGTVTDRTAVTLTLNGAAVGLLTVDPMTKSFLSLEPLVTDGAATLTLVATDAAGNVTTATRRITRDATPPVVTVLSPDANVTVNAASISVAGSVQDLTTTSLTVNGAAVTIAADGGFSTNVALVDGSNTITIVATDVTGNVTTTTRSVTKQASVQLPPDPSTVAPALNRTTATTVAASTAFLYSGTSPIQTGVAAGTIQPYQASVVRGKVTGRDGAPLSGVAVSVLRHSEFGQTLTRVDGQYDLAVNGGEPLVLNLAKTGYLSAQRQLDVGRQQWATSEDVTLVALDTAVTTVDLSQPASVARGSVVVDASGTRRATLLFEQGTEATMVMSDGSSRPISSLAIRATEYTVGPKGLAAMPGPLPARSAYTYAAELSVDEAIAASAKSVQFTKPVTVYVENFLGFPVGGVVPVATYDRATAVWVPEKNGRVIKILSVNGGAAAVDFDGSGSPASATTLAANSVTDAELQRLAQLYQPGQTLWRYRLQHFSPHDANWPYPQDKEEMRPQQKPARPLDDFADGAGGGATGGAGGTKPTVDDQDTGKEPDEQVCACGSVIGTDRRTLGESVPVTGTSLALVYSSERTPGYRARSTYDVALTDDVPDSLLRQMSKIFLRVSIAGRQALDSFPATVGLHARVAWDGKDAYGRVVQGVERMLVQIGYEYSGVKYGAPVTTEASFGQASGTTLSTTSRLPVVLWQTVLNRKVGGWNTLATGLGGWSLSEHHSYDPSSGTLYLGTGEQRSAGNLNPTVVGLGNTTWNPTGIVANPDGSMLVVDDRGASRILRIARDGTQSVFAGNGTSTLSGDGGPAVSAGIAAIQIVRGPDGSIYFMQNGTRIRKIDPQGIITTIAGNGTCGNTGDGGPATLATICQSTFRMQPVTVGPDGSVYLINDNVGKIGQRVRRIAPDGIISHFAGVLDGDCGYGAYFGNPCQENVPAISTPMSHVLRSLAVMPDGAVLIGDSHNAVIWKVGLNGIRSRFAGIAQNMGNTGDGGQARNANIGSLGLIATAPDGSVYVQTLNGRTVRKVGTDGVITTVVGNGSFCSRASCPPVLNMPALQIPFSQMQGLAVSSDNVLYLTDNGFRVALRMTKPLPGFDGSDIAVASQDGTKLYRFDGEGRHLSTIDASSGVELRTFAYDAAGRLTVIQHADGQRTTIARTATGQPQAIVAPSGERTALALDDQGYLASVRAPGGDSTAFTYDPTGTGLLLRRTEPSGAKHEYAFNAVGLLVSDTDGDGLTQMLTTTTLSNGRSTRLAIGATTAQSTKSEEVATGGFRQSVVHPSGLTTTLETGGNDSTTVTSPDGTIMRMVKTPDPRFGMQAPLAGASIRLPSGLTRTVRTARSVTLATPGDAMSLIQQVDSTIDNSSVALLTYNAAARTRTHRTPGGRLATVQYDALGRVVQQTSDGLATTTFSYNGNDQVDRVTYAGRTTQLSYDAAGRLALRIDPAGRRTAFIRDSLGHIVSSTTAAGETRSTFNALGQRLSVTPAGKPAHTFLYTPGGLLQSYRAPLLNTQESSTTRYRYDMDERLREIERPAGDSVHLAYDAAGRLTRLATDDAITRFAYSTATGMLSTIADSGGSSYDYGYDGSLVTSISLSGAWQASVQYGYDNYFRIRSIGIGGVDILRTFDADGLLLTAGALTQTRDSQTSLVQTATVANVQTLFQYDSIGTPSGAKTTANGAPIYEYRLQRDVLDRVVSQLEIVNGITRTRTFDYDSAGRLASVTTDGAPTASYAYDANGNRIRRTSSSGVESGVVDAQDRLISFGNAQLVYRAGGELQYKITGSDTIRYQYDARGALRRVALPDGTRIDYVIDPLGRRIGKRVNGVLRQGFLYQDDLKIGAELAPDGTILSRFVYGGGINVPEYLVRAGDTYRIVTDHLGSVRLVVDAVTGVVAQRLEYDEYGRVLVNTNPGFQPFGFAGGLLDEHTGLVRFGMRDYDPTIGRFTTKDPIGLLGGMNLYDYAGADPVNATDPLGLLIEVPNNPRVIDVWARLLESPTFKKMWLAVAMAPLEEALYTVQTGSQEQVMAFSLNASVTGHTACTLDHHCTTWIARESLGEEHMIDEFLHAAASFGLRLAREAGVPPACYSHAAGYVEAGCDDIKTRIKQELEKARRVGCLTPMKKP